MENRTHSTEYPALVEAITEPQEVVTPNTVNVPEVEIETPPSIHHITKNLTFLSKEIGLEEDTEQSRILNDFILGRMKEEGFEDNKEGFNQVLKEVLKESGITMRHSAKAKLDIVYKRFMEKKMSASDYLKILDIIVKRNARSSN